MAQKKEKNYEDVDSDIEKINKETIKPLRIRFCTECKSADVRFVFRLKNLFGLIPRIECLKCGNSSNDFPIVIVNPKNKKIKKGVKKK